MKQNYLKTTLMLLCLLMAVNVWSEEVTYTVTDKSIRTDGTAPSGSSVTYSHTNSLRAKMTSGNSTTLTLSGYEGCKITGIKLNMSSNSTGGAGTFSAIAGTTTLASISSATTFDNWYDNTAYTGIYNYVDINVTMVNNAYEIQKGENVVITIAATVNSLYINSYTITYESPNTEEITTNESGTASYVTTNALDFSNSNLEAYVVTKETETALTLAKVTEVPAGTPIVVKGAEGTYEIPFGTCTTAPAANLLCGSTTEGYDVSTATTTVYALSKTYGDFRPVSPTITIPAGKAYIISQYTDNNAKTLNFNGIATAINTINNNTESNSAYNFAGQHVNANTKGLIIKNGKKYINK